MMKTTAVRRPLCLPLSTILITASSLLLLSCSGQDSPRDEEDSGELVQVKLALNWFPEAEHGGYYAALVHGLYRQGGLSVKILAGGPDAPVIQRVATGAVVFGLTNADGVLNARAAGANVVALLAPYQTNPRCIMVHQHSGITAIDQIADITLALSQRPAFSHYLRHKYPMEGVVIVPYHGGVSQFLLKPGFAQQAYVFSEPIIARRNGAQVRTLMVADTGFNPYASVLIASDQTVAQKPDLVAAMVRAAAAGWRQYLRAPEETNRHIHELNPEMDIEILAEGARISRDLVLDAAFPERIGHMTAVRWRALEAQMVAAEVLTPGSVNADSAYTNRFLP
jgi:NitT/TauT family transport system substrate-binding protein